MNLHSLLRAFVITSLLLTSLLSVQAQSAAEQIKLGDASDAKFQSSEALVHYLAAEKLEPGNAVLLSRIARQYRHQMTDASSREEKLRLGKLALEYSNKAASAGPNDSDAQIAPGITYGKMMPLLSTKEQVSASTRIKSSADKAIQLNARNDTAWYVLGRWNRVLADVSAVKRALGSVIYGALPTTTNEAAVVCFEKAIKINPNRVMHHIELGITYAQMGRKDDARKAIDRAVAMPNSEKDDAENKRRGREALAKLK